MHLTKPIRILLVEDNEGDIYLTLEAFKEGKFNNSIAVVRDGAEALQYLLKEEPYTNVEMPDLILLDINLPKMDGKEVLKVIKSHEILKSIPVIILTTSSSETDIIDSYNGHANCYVIKPVKLETFLSVARSIENFWISIVTLPR
ncbi:MAG: response regulator [Lacibacter sp.]|jgi:CheY-like chemotaxis protein